MDTVTIDRVEYEALLAAREDLEDLRAFDRAVQNDEESLPAALAKRALEGENLVRLCREHRDMSIGKLAERAGVHGTALSRIENGSRGARPDTIKALANALGVTVDDLI
ncbi:Helix-turn-helix [Palleronia marisminoris]|uniref:HTH-type transcriptional repressor RghR n=1 Tax=Palleronia marisminoris TaxID=315423 RepID=A0A1Y5SN39_9RHOB|nr:helix-turn-helix transcriptional regulator [Palleronia marisminoris]SFG89265.1 Helix-turn-helix [Palleronia marisminoris]SLN43902.1 HTH-type transcriptional repressor RghR [Palleronia marisminoris]